MSTTQSSVDLSTQSLSECIREEAAFVEMRYHNICTGEIHAVPTGLFSYIMFVPFFVLFLTIVGFALLAFINYLKDSKRRY